MGKIAFVIIAVVVLGGLVFLFQGNHSNVSSLFPHFPVFHVATTMPPGGSAYVPPTRVSSTTTAKAATTSTPSVSPSDIPSGYTAAQLSPYFHRVRFGSLTPVTNYYSSSYGQITLSTYSYGNATGTIDVTGWRITANHGGEYIPQAVTYYDPLGLDPMTDIFLKHGDTLYLYSTSAPVNLWLNECMGYLPNKGQFKPALPNSCPSFDRSAIQSFSGVCQNYILSLGACKIANTGDPRVPQNDYACQTYLENHFNYRSCYDAHRTDKNFLSNTVRVWMGGSPIDRYHDIVKLLDRNGLLVDIHTY